jgi:RNA polymerase sigma factor (sigma-70 family)
MMRDTPTQFDPKASDRVMIELISRGEHVQDAWDTLLARHSNLIYTVPRRYGLQETDASDVYQAVCEALWREIATLRDPDRLSAWLLAVAGRLTWRVVARNRRQAVHEGTLPDEGATLPDLGLQPDAVLLRREEWHTVASAVHSLPERCRRLIWYLYYDDANPAYGEIARRMNLAEGSIGPIRRRCLSRLKKELHRLER